MVEAVIFDMDGLLVDSEPLWQRARIEAFGAERLRWTPEDQERIMGRSTQSWAAYLAERLEHAFTPQEIIARVVGQMVSYYRQAVPLMPGAETVLQRLAPDFVLGVASGSPRALLEAILERTGWGPLFRVVVSSDDVAQGKPAPDTYLLAIERLGIFAGRVAVVEDSANGILAGVAAGAHVIAVPAPYHRPSEEVLARADRVLPSLDALDADVLATL